MMKPDEMLTGFPSRFASQALLHPTGNPDGSKGPWMGAGPESSIKKLRKQPNPQVCLQFGPRSTGQSATGHPTLSVTLKRRLSPSTRETERKKKERKNNGQKWQEFCRKVRRLDHHKSRYCHLLVESTPQQLQEEHQCRCEGHTQGLSSSQSVKFSSID
jgi:hypothetical protein